MTETIEGSGYPLAFLVSPGPRPSLLGAGKGRVTYITEARLLGGHQKEAIVHEGAGGMCWRMTSDEGAHLGGKDISPFPLGFFNAGIQGDIIGRMVALGAQRDIPIDDIRLFVQNYYWLTGSFIRGTGEGFADPPLIRLSSNQTVLETLLFDAIAASPAVDALARALSCTFALYVNGHRQSVSGMPPSAAPDAPDPFITYAMPPSPHPQTPAHDPIGKTGHVEQGAPVPAAASVDGRLLRKISGLGQMRNDCVEVDSWLENMTGFAHFAFRTDERANGIAGPSGLANLSAGIAFCFMTQLARYISNMKLAISGVRLVQYSPFEVTVDGKGIAGPVDTHLFLNGRADTETHETLLRVAARTCYLHAALAASVPPMVEFNMSEDVH